MTVVTSVRNDLYLARPSPLCRAGGRHSASADAAIPPRSLKP